MMKDETSLQKQMISNDKPSNLSSRLRTLRILTSNYENVKGPGRQMFIDSVRSLEKNELNSREDFKKFNVTSKNLLKYLSIIRYLEQNPDSTVYIANSKSLEVKHS